MLTNNHKKLIRSLQQKKQRIKNACFVAESPKVIQEFLDAGYSLKLLFTTDSTLFSKENAIVLSERELKSISYLTNPNTCLAVFTIPSKIQKIDGGLRVALDAVRDPGNLGTIIRLCDWFGTHHILCATDTVDCYNPKVVQASMGSLARVQVEYLDLQAYLSDTELPVYGAFMDGESIYTQDFPQDAVLVMGNEANGVRPEIEKLLDKRISIPRFGKLQQTESLNVATATAIILSEFRRTTEK